MSGGRPFREVTSKLRDIDDGGYGLDYSEDIIPDNDNVSNEAQPITGGQSQGIAAQEPKRKKAKSRPASASEGRMPTEELWSVLTSAPLITARGHEPCLPPGRHNDASSILAISPTRLADVRHASVHTSAA
ncbi:hypothetical protein ACOMHN_031579 [Nucella lapillus]